MKTAEELAERGANRAAAHADRVSEGWSKSAMAFLRLYAACTRNTFTTETVRRLALYADVLPPPDARAWGAVVKRAHREGIIEPCGYAKAGKSGHAGPRTLWRRKQ